jgi:hypothetical protein
MLQLNPNQSRQAIEASMMARVPLMLWGAPGIGKSNVVEQIASDLGATLIDIRLSQYDSVDLRGIPSVDKELHMTTWNAPATLPFVGNPAFDNPANKDKLIMLFLDELLQALPAVQSVAFQLVLDGKAGEHTLLPNVRVLAASNRETDKAGTNRMLTPLANRFTHIEMVPTLDPWCDWAWAHNIDPRLVAFVRFRPDLLTTFDSTKNEKVFASPRTWAYVDRFLKQKLSFDILSAMVHGSVGSGPATEFMAFLDVWEDMPNIDGILMNPDSAPVPPASKPGTMFAVCAALSQRADKGNLGNVCVYLDRLPAEYAVRCIKDATKRKLELHSTKAFNQFVTKYSDLMRL